MQWSTTSTNDCVSRLTLCIDVCADTVLTVSLAIAWPYVWPIGEDVLIMAYVNMFTCWIAIARQMNAWHSWLFKAYICLLYSALNTAMFWQGRRTFGTIDVADLNEDIILWYNKESLCMGQRFMSEAQPHCFNTLHKVAESLSWDLKSALWHRLYPPLFALIEVSFTLCPVYAFQTLNPSLKHDKYMYSHRLYDPTLYVTAG